MDLNALSASLNLVIGVLALVGFANLVDYGFRTMAEGKARRAEDARFARWGLPAPPGKPEAQLDEHLWRF